MSVLGKVMKVAKFYGVTKGKKLEKSSPAIEIPDASYDYLEKASSEVYSVGFAKTVIMPPDIFAKKYYVAGYRNNNPATGVHDDMECSAIWIDDKSGRGGVIFVSVDSVGLTKYYVDQIKATLESFKRKSGCRSINILSTHNHAGIDTMGFWGPVPRSGIDADYMRIVYAGIKQVVEKAYKDSRDGDLYVGSKSTPDIQKDGRLPVCFSDVLTRLRFVPRDGSREIWLLNYAAHSGMMLGKNSLVSADFPKYVREEIKEKTGADSIYFVGAIGGIISLKSFDDDNITSTKMGGKAVAETALAIDNDRKLSPVINFIKQEFYVDMDNLIFAVAATTSLLKGTRYSSKSSSLKTALKSEITYFDLDGFHMLLLPGELFPELAFGGYLSAQESAEGKSPDMNPDPLIKICNDENLVIFGLSNDEIGYIVPPNDYMLNPDEPFISPAHDRLGRRHYEETNSLGPNTAVRIAQVVSRMMNTVNEIQK